MKYSEIGAAIFVGLLFGFLSLIAKSFLFVPNKLFRWPNWIYHIRFFLIGIFFGIGIGLLLFILKNIETKDANVYKYLIIGSLSGIITQAPLLYFIWKRSLKKVPSIYKNNVLFHSSAFWINKTQNSKTGIFFIDGDKCKFYDEQSKSLLLEKSIKELNPRIKRNKQIPLIKGLILDESEGYIQLDFPYFWQKKIKDLQ